MPLKPLVALFLVVVSLFTARDASAEPLARGFGEMAAGVRTLDLGGSTLTTSSAGASSAFMRVEGREVSPLPLGAFTLGGGGVLGPVLGGVEITIAMGGGASAPSRAAGDIDVRPSGFVVAANMATYLGVMVETRRMRYRLDGALGTEIAGLEMMRPGFPDTDVRAVNTSRWTLGPRLRADVRLAGGASIGLALGTDARSPGNVMLSFVVTTL